MKDVIDVKSMEFYCLGREDKYMLPWHEVDDICIPLHMKDVHWVLCVVRLQEWRIDVYDCQPSVVRTKELAQLLEPLCELIPYVIDVFMTDEQKKRYRCFSPKKMTHNRLPLDIVPECDFSGDCGVFTFMYIEYLTASLDLSNVVSKNIPFWRNKWAVRLFYSLLEP